MLEMKKLNYDYQDLSPLVSAETLRAHYEVLYKGYVNNYNDTLSKLDAARSNNDYTNIKALEKNLAFQGAGAILHGLYFENLEPHSTAISLELMEKITADFGGFEQFKEQFINNLINIEGSGWGILGYSKSLNKLIILQAEKHQNQTIWDFYPLLVIDIWEHAYYLDYQTNKKAYAENVFDYLNWQIVHDRYQACLK